jgi:hypothetical protein
VLRHVLDVVLVLDESIGTDPVLISLFESLGEMAGIFVVKNNENAVHSAFLFGVLPVTLVALGLWQVFEQTEPAPIAKFVLVLPETLGANAVARDAAIPVQPGSGELLVELAVVVGLQR